MANKNDKNNIKDERIEDVTMYGEFISSFHQWNTLDRQKKIADHLEDVTEISSDLTNHKMQKDDNKKRSN